MYNYVNKYNLVIFPTYRYATFLCDKAFNNVNFDNILKELGKFCFNEPEAGVDKICGLIRDKINKEWKLNGYKNRAKLKRVSATQIKTIRRTFVKISNKREEYVRIPFNVVSIIFFVIQMLNSIKDISPSVKQFFLEMDCTCIRDFLYLEHTSIFLGNYDKRINNLTDPDLIDKYKQLNANLDGQYSIMKKKYSDVDWNNSNDYIIK